MEVDELHVVIYLWSKGLAIDFLVVGFHYFFLYFRIILFIS